MRVAVVGHLEWCSFAEVERVPRPGEIVHASDGWEEPAGGGAVAAVQLARRAGECVFFTALGDDELAHRSRAELERRGVRVEAATREGEQRRAFVHLDAAGERTITVIGERLAPRRSDPLPWEELAEADAVYLTAGDAGAIRAAREAGRLVATVRTGAALAEAGVRLDALVASARDAGERYSAGDLDPPPEVAVLTEGARGGVILTPDGASRRWDAPPLPGPARDSYGAGDTFAAGLTYALGRGAGVDEAVGYGSRFGAAAVSGRGPYGAELPGWPGEGRNTGK